MTTKPKTRKAPAAKPAMPKAAPKEAPREGLVRAGSSARVEYMRAASCRGAAE